MTTLTKEQIDALVKSNGGPQKDSTDINVSLADIESFGNKKSVCAMYSKIAAYNRMLQSRITFINPELTKAIPFTRENLYLITAYTGNGKSTIAANIAFSLWQEKKKTLIISNEEPEHDILYRIACIALGQNFNSYKKGMMPISVQKECLKLFDDISNYVKILDVEYNGGLTFKKEGVINALEAVKSADYSAVMIDYFQKIQYSVENKNSDRYSVLNDFGMYMARYIRSSNIPIVLFAQLHSMGKRNNVDLDSRIKECPNILEQATVALEVIPDFEHNTTDFIIKKDRFGYEGMKMSLAFDRGKFVAVTDEFKQRVQKEKTSALLVKAGLEDLDETPKEPEIVDRIAK